jgi:hypothetical protein
MYLEPTSPGPSVSDSARSFQHLSDPRAIAAPCIAQYPMRVTAAYILDDPGNFQMMILVVCNTSSPPYLIRTSRGPFWSSSLLQAFEDRER